MNEYFFSVCMAATRHSLLLNVFPFIDTKSISSQLYLLAAKCPKAFNYQLPITSKSKLKKKKKKNPDTQRIMNVRPKGGGECYFWFPVRYFFFVPGIKLLTLHLPGKCLCQRAKSLASSIYKPFSFLQVFHTVSLLHVNDKPIYRPSTEETKSQRQPPQTPRCHVLKLPSNHPNSTKHLYLKYLHIYITYFKSLSDTYTFFHF